MKIRVEGKQVQRLGGRDSHVGVTQGPADPCGCCVRGEYRVEVGEMGRDRCQGLAGPSEEMGLFIL